MSGDWTWSGARVLVTGGQGFLGAWLVERLLAEGAEVTVPHRDSDPRGRFSAEGIGERCRVVHADLSDLGAMRSAIEDSGAQVIFHLAAQAIVGIANRSPLSTWESNVRGTYTLLEVCRRLRDEGSPVERIVVASTDHAYGDHEEMPYREDYALRATYPYDVSKACADMVARAYAATYELPVAVTRLANIYGGGDRNWSRIVPDTIRALIEGRRPVIRSDGTPERDFLYVEDAVEAYLAIAGSLGDPALHGRAWNAGWGRPVSVLELVQSAIAVSGRDVEPDVQGAGKPRAEIDRQFLDASRIRDELGWEPRFPLEDGLARSWDWYERHLAAA